MVKHLLMIAAIAVLSTGLSLTVVSTAESGEPDPTGSAVPTSSASPVPTLPDLGAPTFEEDFDTPAAAGGPFAATYAQSWQPYPDGMGGKYWSGKIISAHDGSMDVAMDGEHGAAGTFGTPTGAWTHVGGTFSIRARATGGGDNGLAVMLWPTSDDWSEGELNYPEGNFDGAVHAFHHLMVPGHEQEKVSYTADVSWRDWHTYTTQWVPGKYVRYYLDGKLVMSVTHDVPTTPHRYMFQIGNWGSSGHLLIDWVRTWDRT